MKERIKYPHAGIVDDKRLEDRWLQGYMTDGIIYTTRSGSLWRGLQLRIKNKSYSDMVLSFNDFQDFSGWCQDQEEYYLKDENGNFYEIDKDLLGNGCVYSRQTCVFIPRELNTTLQGIGSMKKGKLVGSSYLKRDGCWRSYLVEKNKQIHLGRFKTQELAHREWKLKKADLLENFLNRHCLSNKLIIAVESLIAELRS